MKREVTILTDIPDWTGSTVEALENEDWAVKLIDILHWRWTASEGLPDWGLVFNRIAARPANDELGLLTQTRDLLTAIDLAGIPCLNGARCHAIGISKVMQASIFASCGAPTPRTHVVIPENLKEQLKRLAREFPLLIKPNVGGRGSGISSPENFQAETFALDGCAILQEQIQSGDGRVHRVEMLGGELLYEATVPLETDAYDYCLAGADEASLTVSEEVTEEVALHCRRIAKAASLDLGSIEYLIDKKGSPQFIDINPVSSFVPNLTERLGLDPFRKISELLDLMVGHQHGRKSIFKS